MKPKIVDEILAADKAPPDAAFDNAADMLAHLNDAPSSVSTAHGPDDCAEHMLLQARTKGQEHWTNIYASQLGQFIGYGCEVRAIPSSVSTPAQDATALADRLSASIGPYHINEFERHQIVAALRATSQTPDAGLKPILENLDGLDKQRTAGPWRKTHDNITSGDRSIAARLVARCDTDWGGGWKHDPTKGSKNARFIVALENAWPKIRAALSTPSASAGPQAAAVKLRALFLDHYWDSLEDRKAIIMKHIDFVLSLTHPQPQQADGRGVAPLQGLEAMLGEEYDG